MEILEVYETLEAIPEEVRENYMESDDGTFSLTLVKGLKSALGKERENVKYRDIQLAKMRDEITSAVTTREAELQEEFSQREAGIRKEALETAHSAKKKAIAVTALQKVDGNILLLEDKVAAQLAVDEDGEVFVASKDGTPELDEAGNPMTVDGLVASFRTNSDFKGAFKGNGQSGGGGGGNENGAVLPNGGIVNVPERRGKMTPKQKVEFIKEFGDDKFQSLPA